MALAKWSGPSARGYPFNVTESVRCPVCMESLYIRTLTIIDAHFLKQLEKYKDESSCVVDQDGDYYPSGDDEHIAFDLAPDNKRLITSMKCNLPMITAALP
jgi:hypothetical protein